MKVYISKDAGSPLIEYISKFTDNIVYVYTDKVYPAISSHPDIYMCQMGDKIFKGNEDKLGYDYPKDIIYNAACVGNCFIHNLKYTDDVLLQEAKSKGYTLINVKQGYSKCNILPIGKNGLITSDEGIAKACKDHLDVLLIESGHILLPQMNYGFIGGCSGQIYDTVVFNGDLSAHPDFDKIVSFTENRQLKCKWFSSYPLTDIGSILTEY